MRKFTLVFMVFMAISAAFSHADEKADRTLEMLRQLAGNPSIWSGSAGASNITRINNALNNATNQGPSLNNLLYVAARSISAGDSYIDAMILMESGISPQLMVAIINEIMKQPPDEETGHYLYFTRLLNLPSDAAASLTLIGENHADFLANPTFPGASNQRVP